MKLVPNYIRASILTVLLLAGLAADRFFGRPTAADGVAYQEAMRQVEKAIPARLDLWFGTDTPVPPAAVALLRPNVIVSRRFDHIQTGRSISILMVHCSDARDLLGHYPPVCYPSSGYQKLSAQPVTWQVGGVSINGTRYEFSITRPGGVSRVVVDDFMILPDGRTCPDMEGVDRVARDRRQRYTGVAQVQFIADVGVSDSEREQFMSGLISANQPLMDVLRRGGDKVNG